VGISGKLQNSLADIFSGANTDPESELARARIGVTSWKGAGSIVIDF
jgi:hypothetical protein